MTADRERKMEVKHHMTEMIIGFVAAVAVFAGIWVLWLKRARSDTKKPVFSCSHCGEKHCDCHRD